MDYTRLNNESKLPNEVYKPMIVWFFFIIWSNKVLNKMLYEPMNQVRKSMKKYSQKINHIKSRDIC